MLKVPRHQSWKTRKLRNFHFWVTDSKVEIELISKILHGLETTYMPKDRQEKVLRFFLWDLLEMTRRRPRKCNFSLFLEASIITSFSAEMDHLDDFQAQWREESRKAARKNFNGLIDKQARFQETLGSKK